MSGGRSRPRSGPGTPRQSAPSRCIPIKDLGPHGHDRFWLDRIDRVPEVSHVAEAIELAAVRAETAVRPFLMHPPQLAVRGRAAVGLQFLDGPTLSLFLRCGALTGKTAFETRLMVRMWASAEGDALVDEHMATVVANSLQIEFEGRLHATVFSWRESKPR